MSNCQICSRELRNADDPLSRDYGGDCQMCMAEAGDPFANRNLWVFSFGFTHAHRVDGITWDKDSLVGIVGDNNAARDKMFELFGPKWAMQYRFDKRNHEYFPRGVVKWYSA